MNFMNREPWLAVYLSSIVPGAGQIYARRFLAGIVMLVSMAALCAFALYSLYAQRGNFIWGVYALGGMILIQIANLITAHRLTRAGNDAAFEEKRRAAKDPWLAIWLTSFLPGLGHCYL